MQVSNFNTDTADIGRDFLFPLKTLKPQILESFFNNDLISHHKSPNKPNPNITKNYKINVSYIYCYVGKENQSSRILLHK